GGGGSRLLFDNPDQRSIKPYEWILHNFRQVVPVPSQRPEPKGVAHSDCRYQGDPEPPRSSGNPADWACALTGHLGVSELGSFPACEFGLAIRWFGGRHMKVFFPIVARLTRNANHASRLNADESV